jgi:hypothetical protein
LQHYQVMIPELEQMLSMYTMKAFVQGLAASGLRFSVIATIKSQIELKKLHSSEMISSFGKLSTNLTLVPTQIPTLIPTLVSH